MNVDCNGKLKQQVALLSIMSNSLLVCLKIVVGLTIGSIGIFSEGLHSGMDLLASLIAFFAVKKASVPPDEDHAFGHGKFENVSGAVEAILIIIAALLIIKEAVGKLLYPTPPERLEWGLLVMLVSVIVNVIVSRRLKQVADLTDSPALAADALHLSTDIWTSVGVLVGLVIMKVTGWPLVDPLIAIGVALVILKAGFGMTWESMRELTDVALPEQEEQLIHQILQSHNQRFVGYHRLRTRKSGGDRQIDLHLVVQDTMQVGAAHELCDFLEQEIKQQLGANSTIVIHIEPCGEDCTRCKAGDCIKIR